MKMEIALVANVPRASLSFDLTAHNNALQLNMEELKVFLSANIKIEEREEKREVCDITYLESGHEETWDYSVIIYGFEFRYLGRTKLVELSFWDGSSQLRPWKSDICTSNESPLSFFFRLEIEGIVQRKEGNTRIKNGLLTLKAEVTLNSKSARHLPLKQLMPDEILNNKLPEDEDTINGIQLETFECFESVEPLSITVPSSPQNAEEILYNKMPEEEDTMNDTNLEGTECYIQEGFGTLNTDKKPDKEFIMKNENKNENTSERSKYGAAKSYEDFPFFHQKLIWLFQLPIAVVVAIIIGYFSILTHSMQHVLVPIILVISRSYAEPCIPEATLEVGNVTPLKPCETCDFYKLNCQGNNISVCLNIFPTTQFAVGCAPNICINDGCPEWNGGKGSYKIQYRNGECGSTCPGHFSLAEWIKNCTISPPPSFGANCLLTTSGGKGSDHVTIIVASFLVAVVGIVVVVGLLILRKKKLLCFKNRGRGEESVPEGENLNPSRK
ncbi:uncharacterized protein LOC134231708 isoform X2 [Saccostrea cucullata]|uniref:uncharacterized protein LOC134231708 isoform X2 n=1 Tax=Saccostrea cuccullata TaxID=36930 RepID=UPI002ECFE6FF